MTLRPDADNFGTCRRFEHISQVLQNYGFFCPSCEKEHIVELSMVKAIYHGSSRYSVGIQMGGLPMIDETNDNPLEAICAVIDTVDFLRTLYEEPGLKLLCESAYEFFSTNPAIALN